MCLGSYRHFRLKRLLGLCSTAMCHRLVLGVWLCLLLVCTAVRHGLGMLPACWGSCSPALDLKLPYCARWPLLAAFLASICCTLVHNVAHMALATLMTGAAGTSKALSSTMFTL